MSEEKVAQWNDSYVRQENYIFYPHEEMVKFLNRYIRKRIGVDEFRNLIGNSQRPLKAIDFGCGIGAGVRLMHEFGIDAYGVDISIVAIEQPQLYARKKGLNIEDRFLNVVPNEALPYEDGEFDFFVSYGVLDSMPFAAAKKNMFELSRVTSVYGYISLISGDYKNFYQEEEVRVDHECRTIQSYFNSEKCKDLIEGTGFKIKDYELISHEHYRANGRTRKTGRYHFVLEREA